MALLSCFPLIYAHGVDGSVWREIWGAYRPMDSVWGGALGTCFGAWIGAVPIPLDWFVLTFPLDPFFFMHGSLADVYLLVSV